MPSNQSPSLPSPPAPGALPSPTHQSINPPIQESNQQSPQHPSSPVASGSGIASHRRRGKVARLPDRVRQLVNVMLRDGAPYAVVITKLAELGYTLTPVNLSRWFTGGHQTWLREENLLDDQHARLDFAAKVVHKKDSQLIQEASLRIAILRMYNLLLEFDPAVLKERVAENPGAYARILNALCKLTSGAVEFERLRFEQNQPKESLPRL